MADDGIPPWFNVLRADIADLRADFNARLDRLVTQDAFAGEQRRVDEMIRNLTDDLAQERVERLAEDKKLETAVRDAAKASADAVTNLSGSIDDAKQKQETRKITFRQGIWLAVVGILGTGVVSLIILVIQNAAHLGGGS
jgi:hypothetical protein